MPKVVLDTNILIGILLGSRNCRAVRDAFLDGKFDVVISDQLFAEFLETVKKPKLKGLFMAEDIKQLATLLQYDAEWVTAHTKVSVARDVDDNVVLECAFDGA